MTTIVAIIFLLIVYRYICYLREASLSLKYKHNIFKLRDRLRSYAINGDIPNDDFFMVFDGMLTGLIKNADDFNIYYLALRSIFLVSVSDEDMELYKKEFLVPVEKNKKYTEIHHESRDCFYNYLAHKHIILFSIVGLIIKISSSIDTFIKTLNDKVWYDSSRNQNINYEYVLHS